MKRILTAIALVLCLLIILGGCARTYWADDTDYDNRAMPRATANVTASPQGGDTPALPRITRGTDRDTDTNRNMRTNGRTGIDRDMRTDRNTDINTDRAGT